MEGGGRVLYSEGKRLRGGRGELRREGEKDREKNCF